MINEKRIVAISIIEMAGKFDAVNKRDGYFQRTRKSSKCGERMEIIFSGKRKVNLVYAICFYLAKTFYFEIVGTRQVSSLVFFFVLRVNEK